MNLSITKAIESATNSVVTYTIAADAKQIMYHLAKPIIGRPVVVDVSVNADYHNVNPADVIVAAVVKAAAAEFAELRKPGQIVFPGNSTGE